MSVPWAASPLGLDPVQDGWELGLRGAAVGAAAMVVLLLLAATLALFLPTPGAAGLYVLTLPLQHPALCLLGAWLVGLPHPWLVALIGGAVVFAPHVLFPGTELDRYFLVHSAVAVGLGAWLLADDLALGWRILIVAAQLATAIPFPIASRRERQEDRRLAVARFENLGVPLLAPQSSAIFLDQAEADPYYPRLRLDVETDRHGHTFIVWVYPAPRPFVPEDEARRYLPYGSCTPDGTDRWMVRGGRVRRSYLIVLRHDTLIVLGGVPVPDENELRRAADSLRPIDAAFLASLD